jgi:hypothetical protein
MPQYILVKQTAITQELQGPKNYKLAYFAASELTFAFYIVFLILYATKPQFVNGTNLVGPQQNAVVNQLNSVINISLSDSHTETFRQ